jgi:hypothetical protein
MHLKPLSIIQPSICHEILQSVQYSVEFHYIPELNICFSWIIDMQDIRKLTISIFLSGRGYNLENAK